MSVDELDNSFGAVAARIDDMVGPCPLCHRLITLGAHRSNHGGPCPGGERDRALADRAAPVAMGDYTRERHPDAERILALLHVAGIDTGCRNADADLPRASLGGSHLAYNQDARWGALSLVPSSFHKMSNSGMKTPNG